jgi:antitoxin (DNA-binding transcriptional repressor) of toxin-antitoxin stability system
MLPSERLSNMHQVNIEEAKIRLPDLIDAAVNGEEVVIAKDEQHLVRLVPVARAKSRPQFGSAEGLITMSDDFDEPLKDFEEYMK